MRTSKPLPQGADKERAVREMFDKISGRYDLVNRVMTFGMDVRWRRYGVRELRLSPGALIADVACGTGDFCREIESRGGSAVGLDMSLGMLQSAHTDSPLVQADGLRLPLRDGSVDGVTCGFALRNVLDIGRLFAEFARVVRSGGRAVILEVAEPRSKALRAGHTLYFRKLVPLVGRVLSDKEAYSYLPRSTEYLPPTPQLVTMLEGCGFTDVSVKTFALGAAQLLSATRA